MNLSRLGVLAAVVATACIAPRAHAESLALQVASSQWDTRYETPGRNVRAILKFDGKTGSYDVMDEQGNIVGTGSLTNVKYFDVPVKTGGMGVMVTGGWSFLGQTGGFQFEVAGNASKSIHGRYNRSNGQKGGAWSGSRVQNNDEQPGGGEGTVTILGEDSGFGVQSLGSQEVLPLPVPAEDLAAPLPPTDAGPISAELFEFDVVPLAEDPFSQVQAPVAVVYSDWSFNEQKGYHYRKCQFPAGGHQYVIFYRSIPNWVFWFNPAKGVYWCKCPTTRHPEFGDEIANGQDLFLMASKKGRSLQDTEFPVADELSDFVPGKAKDVDGADVDLGCPPSDLP